jgi:hypothetical protein
MRRTPVTKKELNKAKKAIEKKEIKQIKEKYAAWCGTCRAEREIVPVLGLATRRKQITVKAQKAKGMRFQSKVVQMIRDAFNLGEDDVQSVGSGRMGKDIILSDAAKKKFPFHFPEATCREKLPIWSKLAQAEKHTKGKGPFLLVFARNRDEPKAVVEFSVLLDLIKKAEKS